jgi:acetyltransferase-like isoleucine patch superfamily enzyme
MIHATAILADAKIGNNVVIKEFAVIRDGVILGDNVVIHPHVVIESGVEIGEGVEIFPGAYIGKEPKGAGALARKPEFEKHIKIGANSSIGPHSVIFYDVEIGENTLIGDGASIREKCRIGNRCIISRYVTINYNTSIGDRTKVMDSTHVTGNCVIGDDVFISVGVGMANDNNLGGEGYSEEMVKGPTILDGAAVGVGAILLPGIVINKGAIVASGATATKDVQENSLVAGSPARLVRVLKSEPA